MASPPSLPPLLPPGLPPSPASPALFTIAGGCEELPSWGAPIGILMGIAGSCGINIGQNLQASGILALPEKERVKPWKSRKWQIGMFSFVVFSLINFSALALAPASVLMPLEALQFITNIAYHKLVNNAVVSRRMSVGVGLALVGTVMSIMFGASGGACHSVKQLEDWWGSYTWWCYLAITLTIGFSSMFVRRSYLKRVEAGETPWKHKLVLPITYTLVSALLGGALLIVSAKVFSELLSMLLRGEHVSKILTGWLLYLEIAMVVGCGFFWVFRLTACLALFDPLLILPLMVGTYVLFGGIAGGIFFDEFSNLHKGSPGIAFDGWFRWGLYILGLVLVLGGLYLIADASAQAVHDVEEDVRMQSSTTDLPGQAARPVSDQEKRLKLLTRAPTVNIMPVPMAQLGAERQLSKWKEHNRALWQVGKSASTIAFLARQAGHAPARCPPIMPGALGVLNSDANAIRAAGHAVGHAAGAVGHAVHDMASHIHAPHLPHLHLPGHGSSHKVHPEESGSKSDEARGSKSDLDLAELSRQSSSSVGASPRRSSKDASPRRGSIEMPIAILSPRASPGHRSSRQMALPPAVAEAPAEAREEEEFGMLGKGDDEQ